MGSAGREMLLPILGDDLSCLDRQKDLLIRQSLLEKVSSDFRRIHPIAETICHKSNEVFHGAFLLGAEETCLLFRNGTRDLDREPCPDIDRVCEVVDFRIFALLPAMLPAARNDRQPTLLFQKDLDLGQFLGRRRAGQDLGGFLGLFPEIPQGRESIPCLLWGSEGKPNDPRARGSGEVVAENSFGFDHLIASQVSRAR
jgi:hypothetical protein